MDAFQQRGQRDKREPNNQGRRNRTQSRSLSLNYAQRETYSHFSQPRRAPKGNDREVTAHVTSTPQTPTSVATRINAPAATSFASCTRDSMSTPDPSRKLRGSEPGLLDPTQPSRLLRDPASKLYFASFDPFTACQDDGADRMRNLSLHEKLYRPKRVVVEIAPTGSFWRFVPRATKDDGLENEEHWPRIVEICG